MGRPKKFTTARRAAEAKKDSDRQRYLRRCQQTSRPEFIAYEPQITVDCPITTPTDLGLRISPDIPIPKDLTGLLDDETQDKHVTHRASTLILTDDQDADISEEIRITQANETEWNKEQTEYEAAIAHQMEERVAQTAKGMTEIQLGGVGADTIADTATAEESEAVTLPGEVDLPVDRANSDDSLARGSPTLAAPEATIATTEVLCDVPAPRHRRFTSSSYSSGRSGRNQSPFPAQTNNLLSWL
jgi:hypothetical protein